MMLAFLLAVKNSISGDGDSLDSCLAYLLPNHLQPSKNLPQDILVSIQTLLLYVIRSEFFFSYSACDQLYDCVLLIIRMFLHILSTFYFLLY